LITHRGDTRGAWIQLKKPALENLPVLDVTTLSSAQIGHLSAFYDLIHEDKLLTIANSGADATRERIDDEIRKVLKLPDLTVLRQTLAREPIVSLKTL
jgi:hypothetical protein